MAKPTSFLYRAGGQLTVDQPKFTYEGRKWVFLARLKDLNVGMHTGLDRNRK